MAKFILVGGYPWKATDGGKHFAEELVAGFQEPIKILICLFARQEDAWQASFAEDQQRFSETIPYTKIELQQAEPQQFLEQVKWADVIYFRGGDYDLLHDRLLSAADWVNHLGGKTVVGSSAGAMLLSRYGYDLDDLEVDEGLGLVKAKVLVHYRSNYNAPKIDWTVAEEALQSHGENLPLCLLREGEFTVIK